MKRIAMVWLLAVAPAFADVNSIDEADEKRLWPINEKSQKIPKHSDARTGFIDPSTEAIINAANDRYAPEERQQIIDYCRHDAFIKRTQLLQHPLVAKRLKDKSDGLLGELQEEFQYCAIGMIRSWQADESQEEKDSHR